MTKPNYTFFEDINVLQCYTYAVSIKRNKEDAQLKRILGNEEEDEEEDYVGEPKEVFLDFDKLGGVLYFHEAEADLYEKGNEAKVTFVEFTIGLNFMLLIPYKEFTEIFLKYKKNLNKNASS